MRIKTIDLFRALTMLAMLWVNDFAGLDNIPHWLGHAAGGEDMLGFSDVVFPAFLFIMGVSTPFALSGRLAKEGLWRTILHVVSRTAALLIMGLYTVNYESIDWSASPVPPPVWELGMVAAFFMVWGVRTNRWLQVVGTGILVALYFVYSGRGGSDFGTRWWGILGLIGWSYAVSAAVSLVVRKNLWLNVLALAAAITACVLWQGKFTLYAFSVTGGFVAFLLGRGSSKVLYATLAAGATLMAMAGNIAHDTWIISKIGSTPTWYFYCTGISLALFVIIHSVVEGHDKSLLPKWLAPAGTATLTCYVIPYAWYAIRTLIGVHRPEIFQSGWVGLVGSLVFAVLVVQITGLIGRWSVKLKV